jgi:hypothetical protein
MIKRPLRPFGRYQNAALAIVTVTSSLIATTNNADAQFRRWGPLAIGGAFIAGAVIANSGPYYYDGPRCGWVRQFDRWGNYMGRVRVCNY